MSDVFMPGEAMLIDSHCHLQSLDLAEFDHNLDQVMQQALANDVKHMLSVCISPQDLPRLHAIADRYPNVSTSVGVHPNDILSNIVDTDQIITWADHPSCIAIGETGLDYYRTTEPDEQLLQQQMFRAHIQAARSSGKPLIIHTRHAAADTLRLLKQERAAEIGGVMHCFSEDWDIARQALDLNFYISFSGVITFKNADALREVAKKVPIDRLLIETDAPYLAPIPFRGKQNRPAWVRYVAQALSTVREMEYLSLAEHTCNNFYQCFRVQA